MYFSDIRAQGASHCHATFQSTTVACDPLSEKSSDLNGWNLSLEKNTFAILRQLPISVDSMVVSPRKISCLVCEGERRLGGCGRLPRH